MPLKSIQLDTIRIDGNCQPPGRLGEEEVGDYCEAMQLGQWDWDRSDDPIVVFEDGGDRWLAHGFHRYHAARRAGLATAECLLRTGTLADAQEYAAGCNKQSSRRRSNADKQWAVDTVLKLHVDWSDNRIAKHVGVSATMVATRRHNIKSLDVETRTGADGRTRKMPQRGAKYHNPLPASLGPPLAPPMSETQSQPSQTDDPATEAINRGREINRLALDVFAIKRRLGELKQDPISACLNFNAIETALTNAAQFIKNGVPHAPCPNQPNCAAGRCTMCRGRGWLNERGYKEAQRLLEGEA